MDECNKKGRLRSKLEISDVCLRAPQNSAVLSRTFGLWHVMLAPTFVINGVCLFSERGFAQTPQLNAPHSKTKGCANITQGKKKEKEKKRNNNVRIIPKLGLILYMEFSGTPTSIPSFLRFLSPLPITFSRRIKKGLHGCQEVLASPTRLQGYRDIPLLGLCSPPFHPWSSFSPLPEFTAWEPREAPYHSVVGTATKPCQAASYCRY